MKFYLPAEIHAMQDLPFLSVVSLAVSRHLHRIMLNSVSILISY